MDAFRAAWIHGLAVPLHRREGFAGLLVSLGALQLAAAEAKKRKKRKKKRKAGNGLTQVAACTAVDPQARQTSVSEGRLAFVFRPSVAGLLRRITVDVFNNGNGDEYVVQLLATVQDGAEITPSHLPVDVLASAVVPESAVPEDEESTIAANFNGPRLDPAVAYAVAVGRRGNTNTTVIKVGDGSVCAPIFIAGATSEFQLLTNEFSLKGKVFVA